jgi:hypothetical protein
MDVSACYRMIRVGAWAGFLVAGALFLPVFSGVSEGGLGGRLYDLFRTICLVAAGITLVLSWQVLRKQSRVAAVLLAVPVLLSAFVLISMGDRCDPLAMIFFVVAGLLFAGAWLAGLIGCFTWQSRFAEKAIAAVPAPTDPRPISEEARRMIEGSFLSENTPIFEEDGDPTPDEKTKWGSGILAPIGLAIWAIYALVTKHVIMYDKYYRPPVEIKGLAVYACALALISAALFLHFHYFWGQTPKLYDYYKIPKYTALAVLIVSAFAFFILAVSGS